MTPVSAGNGSRFADRPVAAGGTSIDEWVGWGREFPELNLDDCPALVLVAPHPDDETLGFGATAATLRARGVDVSVVSVTDGGAAIAGLSRVEREWLEGARCAELHRATEILGLAPPICLGLPDGRVSDHEAELTDTLAGLLAGGPKGTWCAATWRGDGHPDHEAVGRASAAAAQRTGAVLLEYPVWMWHWAVPDDDGVPWHRMSRVRLDPVSIARKELATRVFRTQLVPQQPEADAILPEFVVPRLLAVGEAVFR